MENSVGMPGIGPADVYGNSPLPASGACMAYEACGPAGSGAAAGGGAKAGTVAAVPAAEEGR